MHTNIHVDARGWARSTCVWAAAGAHTYGRLHGPCATSVRLYTPRAILKKRPVRHVIHVGARLLLRGAHGVTYTPRARTLRLRTKELGRDPLSTSTSQTPRRRRRANPAGIGCGGQRRSMDGRCASKSRGRGAVGSAHVAICVFSVCVCVRVPEASAAHAHALPPLLADDDLRSRCGGVSGARI